MNTKNRNTVLFWPILLIVLGGAFLLKNFGLVNFHFPVRIISWRLIPLIVGINAFIKGDYYKGIIGVAIAVIFYIPDFLTDPQIDVYLKLWPLGLIGLGGLIAYKHYNPEFDRPNRLKMAGDLNINYINESNIMGGTNSKVHTKNFEGGRINCIMGGAQIDLTEADLAQNSTLDVFILAGGLEMRIPKEWNVKLNVLPIMGGVNDQITKFPENVVDTLKVFNITGNVIMGGIEIKRF